MNADVNRNISAEIPQEEFSIDFEKDWTPIRLGKSNKYFYIDFNDTNFPVRLNEAREEIVAYLEAKQKKYGITDINDPIPDLGDGIENLKALKDLDLNIRAALNKAFGYDVCSDVFGVASTTSITPNGECYYEKFFNSVLPLIEKQFDIRINKFSARTKSYLDRKGMHPTLKR